MHEYFEDAIEPENRDLKHKVLFPSKSTFKGRRWDGWDKDSRKRTIESCDGRLVVTHNDADGLVSGSLFYDFFSGEVDIITIDYENIENTFEIILDNAEHIDEIYVSDLNLDEVFETIGDVADNVNKFVWIDHHEWGEKEEVVRNMGVNITINEDRAAAGLVYEYVLDNGYNDSKSTKEIVKLTEDHDLWNHNMETVILGSHEVCISKVFSQLAFYSDDDKFIENILDYGREFMEYEEELLRGDKTQGFIAQMESEHQLKVNYIVENETEIENIDGYTVAFAHGRASPGDILDELVQTKDIDILIHTKPQYPVKASIRSTDEFSRCHKIAEMLGGGGHEHAAGCKPDNIAQEPFEFINYIQSHGEPLKSEVRVVLEEEILD